MIRPFMGTLCLMLITFASAARSEVPIPPDTPKPVLLSSHSENFCVVDVTFSNPATANRYLELLRREIISQERKFSISYFDFKNSKYLIISYDKDCTELSKFERIDHIESLKKIPGVSYGKPRTVLSRSISAFYNEIMNGRPVQLGSPTPYGITDSRCTLSVKYVRPYKDFVIQSTWGLLGIPAIDGFSIGYGSHLTAYMLLYDQCDAKTEMAQRVLQAIAAIKRERTRNRRAK